MFSTFRISKKKVYDTTEEILLNTIVEFVGIFYDETVLKNRPDQSKFDEKSTKIQKTKFFVLVTKTTTNRFRWAKRFIAFIIENCLMLIHFFNINRISNAIIVSFFVSFSIDKTSLWFFVSFDGSRKSSRRVRTNFSR